MIADLRKRKAAVTIPAPGSDSVLFHFELWERIVDILEAEGEAFIMPGPAEERRTALLTTWRSLQGER